MFSPLALNRSRPTASWPLSLIFPATVGTITQITPDVPRSPRAFAVPPGLVHGVIDADGQPVDFSFYNSSGEDLELLLGRTVRFTMCVRVVASVTERRARDIVLV